MSAQKPGAMASTTTRAQNAAFELMLAIENRTAHSQKIRMCVALHLCLCGELRNTRFERPRGTPPEPDYRINGVRSAVISHPTAASLQCGRHHTEAATEAPNKVTDIVEPDRVTHVCYGHSRFQQMPRTLKSQANQVLVWRHSDEVTKYAREQERAHRHVR